MSQSGLNFKLLINFASSTIHLNRDIYLKINTNSELKQGQYFKINSKYLLIVGISALDIYGIV